jgi:hypothetical protein
LKRLLLQLAIVGSFSPLIAAAQSTSIAVTGPNCALPSPPVESARSEIHGTTLALFPIRVDRNYTGCQTIWWLVGEDIVQLSTVMYVEGQPRAYRSVKLEPGVTRETRCEYRDGTVIARVHIGGGAEEECPRSETLATTE